MRWSEEEWRKKAKEDVDKLRAGVPELEGSSDARIEYLWKVYSNRVSASWLIMTSNYIEHFQIWYKAVREFFSDNSVEPNDRVNF